MPFNSFENYPMLWKPSLDKNNHTLYKALAEQLEADIQNGMLRPGTKLPPQRELADFLDVNLSTVSKAFKLCELKGLLSATIGSGTYVAYDALTSGRLLAENLNSGIIDMGATVPDDSGNETLRTLLQELVEENDSARLFSYFVPGEDDWQKDIAVRLFSFCGHKADRNQVLISHGGQNALSAILPAMFRRGDKIAVDAHTYPGIKTAAAMYGIQLVPVLQNENGMDTDALETLFHNEMIRGIYLIPACQNPTTLTMPTERRKEVARIAREHDCIVIEDGTYQLISNVQPAVSDYAPERSIYITSLSKGIAPGLRLAYLTAPSQYVPTISNSLYSLNVAVVPLITELAARIIASGQFEEIIKRHKQYTAKLDKIITKWLPKSICKGKETDIFRWLLLPEQWTGTEFEQAALANGVQVYAADRFAVGNTVPAHAVRLSICSPKTPEKLEQGCRILAELRDTKSMK